MAAENLGTIYYTVDAKTDPLVNSGKSAEDQLDKTTAAMGKTDQAAKKLGDTSRKAANDAKGFGKVLGDASNQAKAALGEFNPLSAAIAAVISVEAIRRVGEISQEFTLLAARVARLSGDAQTAAVNYQNLLSIANKTGASLGDTVKLWESLTLTLRDLGGTDEQVARLTETLQKIGAVGGSSSQEMADALRQFGQSLSAGVVRAEEFNSIIEQMPQLAREIAKGLGVPFGQLRQLLLDGKLTADVVLGAIQKQTSEVDAEFNKLPRTIGQAANALANDFGTAVSQLDRAVSASSSLAKFLDLVGKGMRLTVGNLTDLERLNTLVKERADLTDRVAKAQGNVIAARSAEVTGAKDRIAAINAEIKAIQDREVARQKGQTALITGGKKTTGDAQSLKALETLKDEAALAKLTGEERAKAAAIQKLGANATQAEKDQAAALAVEIYKGNQARQQGTKLTNEQAAAAKKANEQALKGTLDNEKAIGDLSHALAQAGLKGQALAEAQAVMRLNPYATPEQIAQVKALADAIYQAQQAQANKQLLGQVDPLAGAQQDYQQQLKDYQTLKDAQLLSDERYNELKAQADTAYAQQQQTLEEQRWASISKTNQLIMDGLNALETQGTQALTGLITGTGSLGDAWRSVASAIVQQGVGALVKFGITQAKNFLMGQTMQATQTATAAASGAAIASAYAPAAAATSIATFGGAAAAGLAGVTAAIPAITGLFGSGKALGGPVQAGQAYRINETGKPEVFQAANGRQYMLPNTAGQVISNRDATKGGAATPSVNVNLIEDPNRAGTVQAVQNADGSTSVDAFVASIRNDGAAAAVLQEKFGLTPVGT